MIVSRLNLGLSVANFTSLRRCACPSSH
jgi:hypothetical protein